MTRYVIITPVRDEEEHLQTTVDAVSRQTVPPSEWVIVNDGSTDKTGAIIDQVAARLPWVRAVHRGNRGFRKSGGGVVEAFNSGYSALTCDNWEFVVKLDGDLSFSNDYFERCFERFERDARLGIGGGEIYHEIDGKLLLEPNPRFHVRGATKVYRRECWKAIGGLWTAPGWDTIDEVKANMLGWTTHSFPELRLVHHRFTGMADGLVANRVKHGVACYVSGYHPLFVAASSVRRLVQKPYVIGSLAMLAGFLKGYFNRVPRVDDQRYIEYIRCQQLRRLCRLESIWK